MRFDTASRSAFSTRTDSSNDWDIEVHLKVKLNSRSPLNVRMRVSHGLSFPEQKNKRIPDDNYPSAHRKTMNSTTMEGKHEAHTQRQVAAGNDFTVDICHPGVITKGERKILSPAHCFQIIILMLVFAIAMYELVRNSVLVKSEFHSLRNISGHNWGILKTGNEWNTKGMQPGGGKSTLASSAGSKERTHGEDRGKWPWTSEPPTMHTSAPAASQKMSI